MVFNTLGNWPNSAEKDLLSKRRPFPAPGCGEADPKDFLPYSLISSFHFSVGPSSQWQLLLLLTELLLSTSCAYWWLPSAKYKEGIRNVFIWVQKWVWVSLLLLSNMGLRDASASKKRWVQCSPNKMRTSSVWSEFLWWSVALMLSYAKWLEILSRARLIIPRHIARKREIKVFNSIRQKRAGGRISLITRPWPHYHLKMKTKTLREHPQRAIQATCCSSSHHLFSPFSLLWLQNSTSSFQRYPMDNIDFYPLYPICIRLVNHWLTKLLWHYHF